MANTPDDRGDRARGPQKVGADRRAADTTPGAHSPAPGGAGTSGGFAERAPALAVSLAFFALGLATAADIGRTADEGESLAAGARNLEIVAAWLSGRTPPPWSFHELRGYYFALDTLRALLARAFAAIGLGDATAAFHFAHLAMASATVYLVHRISRRAGASQRLAAFAALALATLPTWVAHSQNNPKDLPAGFVFSLAVWSLLTAGLDGRVRSAIGAGLALGLAFTHRVLCLLVVPVAWLWLAIVRERPSARWVATQALALAVALPTTLLLWPWTWAAPLERVRDAATGLTTTAFAIPVLYLGRVIPAHDMPWHYRPVLLLATTPLLVLALAALGALSVALPRSPQGRRRAALLGVLWLAALFAADLLSWSRYDGTRHFLLALPALAILAGAGADAVAGFVLARTQRRAAALAVAAVPFALAAASLVALHPYAGAYLNPAARLFAGTPTDATFELEYWGQSYHEGAAWLEANAPPGAEVIVPLFAEVAERELSLPVRAGGAELLRANDRPRYLMLIRRRAYFDAGLRELSERDAPVFRVERSGGTLLAIHANAAARALRRGAPTDGDTGAAAPR